MLKAGSVKGICILGLFIAEAPIPQRLFLAREQIKPSSWLQYPRENAPIRVEASTHEVYVRAA